MKESLKHFTDLSNAELLLILKLRADVFVVEQNCVFSDPDLFDADAFHLMYWNKNNGDLMAYARILPPGTIYPEASIGRVVTAIEYRRNGAGKTLMERAIFHTNTLFPNQPIRIMAQSYLTAFYSSFGFKTKGAEFLEDGIPHKMMILD